MTRYLFTFILLFKIEQFINFIFHFMVTPFNISWVPHQQKFLSLVNYTILKINGSNTFHQSHTRNVVIHVVFVIPIVRIVIYYFVIRHFPEIVLPAVPEVRLDVITALFPLTFTLDAYREIVFPIHFGI